MCQYIGARMPPAPLLKAHRTQKIDKIVRIQSAKPCPIEGPFKKEADRTFRSASPIFLPIAYSLGFTNRKRKYVKEETTTTLKNKQTSIATVQYLFRTLASFSTPLVFHWSLPLKVVGNEKGEGSGEWLLFEDGFRPWRSMSVYCLMLPSSFLQCISVSSM